MTSEQEDVVDLLEKRERHSETPPDGLASIESRARSEILRLRSRVEELEGLVQATVQGSGAVNDPGCQWQDISTAPRNTEPSDETGFPDPILLGCFRKGALLWAMAGYWGMATYGYTHCASRSGWITDFMPEMARGADRPRHPGEWICGRDELAPTHWMPLAQRLGDRTDSHEAQSGSLNHTTSVIHQVTLGERVCDTGSTPSSSKTAKPLI